MTLSPQQAPLIEYGIAALPFAGEAESGDLHLVKPFDGGTLVAVADGSGHGSEAASAARIAMATLESQADGNLITLVRGCHEQLRHTRGAVLSLASFRGIENTVTWMGVGNVEGVLLRSDPAAEHGEELLFLRPGLLGYRLPALQTVIKPVARGDLLILTTDGINGGFAGEVAIDDDLDNIADYICSQYSKKTDDGLVLVARYLGWAK